MFSLRHQLQDDIRIALEQAFELIGQPAARLSAAIRLIDPPAHAGGDIAWAGFHTLMRDEAHPSAADNAMAWPMAATDNAALAETWQRSFRARPHADLEDFHLQQGFCNFRWSQSGLAQALCCWTHLPHQQAEIAANPFSPEAELTLEPRDWPQLCQRHRDQIITRATAFCRRHGLHLEIDSPALPEPELRPANGEAVLTDRLSLGYYLSQADSLHNWDKLAQALAAPDVAHNEARAIAYAHKRTEWLRQMLSEQNPQINTEAEERRDLAGLELAAERQLAVCLERLPWALARCAESGDVALVGRTASELAQLWNDYYERHRLLQGSIVQLSARAQLSLAVGHALGLLMQCFCL